MEVWIIYPIGGILAAIGFLLFLGLAGIWQCVTSNPNVFADFANQNTGVALIIFAIIALLFGILIGCMYYFSGKPRPNPVLCTLSGLAAAIPAFLSFSVCYAHFIDMAHSLFSGMADGLIAIIVTLLWALPVCLVIYFVLILISLIPNALPLFIAFFVSAGNNSDNPPDNGVIGLFTILACAIAVILSILYIWLLNQTDFWIYCQNTFH